MSVLMRFLSAAAVSLLSLPLAGQWMDVTEFNGLEASTQASWLGCGMSLADFNLDGLGDVTLADSQGEVRAYAQLPEGGFMLSHVFSGENQAQGVSWLDVDGDDDLDLLLSRRFGALELHIRDGEIFDNQADLRGLPLTNQWECRGVSVADYDGDSDLDVYLSMYHNGLSGTSTNLLFNNDGFGFFSDVTVLAGVGNGLQQTFQSTWLDFDEDGDLDLWVVNDRDIFLNALYANQGDGTFTDVTEQMGLALGAFARSATVGDHDNDGQFELYCTTNEGEGNLLLDNEVGYYEDVALEVGVIGERQSWGACWIDFDGDMWEDLVVATSPFPFSQPYDNYFFQNGGPGSGFDDVTAETPTAESSLYCVGVTDLNQDLAPDIVGFGDGTFAQTLQNMGVAMSNNHHRLAVRLCGTESNRWAIGARIEVHAGTVVQTQLVSNGSDFMTQQYGTRFFGLAQEESVDSIVVHWPSGLREAWYDWPANTTASLIEGSTVASIGILGSACSSDSAQAVAPFNAPAMLWNGEPMDSAIVPLTESGTFVLTCQWMGGLFEWTDTLEWAMEEPHLLSVGWTEPNCSGELGNLTWQVDSGFVVTFMGNDWPSASGGIQAPGGEAMITTTNGASGCAENHVVILSEPPALGLYIIYEPASCYGDVAFASATGYGGNPAYLVNWFDVNPSALPEGDVPLTLTDDNGCVIDSSIAVTYPTPIEVLVSVVNEDNGFDGSISLELEGGIPPYDVLWNDGTSGELELTDLTTGLYSWVIEDANGCLSLGLQSLINLSLVEIDEQGHWSWSLTSEMRVLSAKAPSDGAFKFEAFGLDGRLERSENLEGLGPWPFDQGGLPPHGFIRLTGASGRILHRFLY